MLAGTIYFYDEDDRILKEIDIEEYEDMTVQGFQVLIENLGAVKVVLGAFYHNHHSGKSTILYEKNKKQT